MTCYHCLDRWPDRWPEWSWNAMVSIKWAAGMTMYVSIAGDCSFFNHCIWTCSCKFFISGELCMAPDKLGKWCICRTSIKTFLKLKSSEISLCHNLLLLSCQIILNFTQSTTVSLPYSARLFNIIFTFCYINNFFRSMKSSLVRLIFAKTSCLLRALILQCIKRCFSSSISWQIQRNISTTYVWVLVWRPLSISRICERHLNLTIACRYRGLFTKHGYGSIINVTFKHF